MDTVLIESDMTAKAILELIPVLNITNLVVGTKGTPCSRYYACYLKHDKTVHLIITNLCDKA